MFTAFLFSAISLISETFPLLQPFPLFCVFPHEEGLHCSLEKTAGVYTLAAVRNCGNTKKNWALNSAWNLIKFSQEIPHSNF